MTAVYKYDVFGNRSEKDVTYAGQGTQVTKFAMDGWNPATPATYGNENYNVWADLNGDGSLATRYIRGDVVDQLFARIGSSGTAWYLVDYQGSIRNVINNSGTVLDGITYDAYGNITSETNSANRGRYSWTGRELDVETNLQYNRARYYDAGTGRWISQDPMGFDAGDSNLYRYVNNKPTEATDPSGKEGPLTQDRVNDIQEPIRNAEVTLKNAAKILNNDALWTKAQRFYKGMDPNSFMFQALRNPQFRAGYKALVNKTLADKAKRPPVFMQGDERHGTPAGIAYTKEKGGSIFLRDGFFNVGKVKTANFAKTAAILHEYGRTYLWDQLPYDVNDPEDAAILNKSIVNKGRLPPWDIQWIQNWDEVVYNLGSKDFNNIQN